jgi:hypothetical protein
MITIDVNSEALHHFENADQVASWIAARVEVETVLCAYVDRPGKSIQFLYGYPMQGQTTVKNISGLGVDKQTYDAVEDALAAFLALLEA